MLYPLNTKRTTSMNFYFRNGDGKLKHVLITPYCIVIPNGFALQIL